MRENLQAEFDGLWRQLGADKDARPLFRDLTGRYSEPHRAYHNLAHIQSCLEEFQLLRPLATAPQAIELAIWYHDAVYDPKANDNEEKSAELAQQAIRTMKVGGALAEDATDIILATKHAHSPSTLSQRIMVDVDLSILGQAEEVFDNYELQIRVEYGWVPDPTFAAGRAKILQAFLRRDFIFSTTQFRRKYEQTARQNLIRSLRQLGQAV